MRPRLESAQCHAFQPAVPFVQAGTQKVRIDLYRSLSILAGLLILLFMLACASTKEGGSAADSQVADVSQFPTPTRARANQQPTSQPVTTQIQATQNADDAAEVAPLRQRLQSGELTEEEVREAFQRIRGQFGTGPGGAGGSQIAGSIESIDESTLTVATELASILVSVDADTIIRVTSVLEPAALTDGSQVLVVSERVEGSTLARAITIIPEGQAGVGRGQGGPVEGRGLFGTIESVNDTGFTLETQQGPLLVVVNEDSVVVETRQGAFADLETGMQVRVAGASDENGNIDARSVFVTPVGLEGIFRPGGGPGVN